MYVYMYNAIVVDVATNHSSFETETKNQYPKHNNNFKLLRNMCTLGLFIDLSKTREGLRFAENGENIRFINFLPFLKNF